MPATLRPLSAESAGSNRQLVLCLHGRLLSFLALLCLAGVYAAFLLLHIGFRLSGPFGLPFAVLGLSFLLMVLDILAALPALFGRWSGRDPLEIELPRQWMSGLHTLVEKVARQRQVDAPDDVRLHADSVAHVYQDERGRKILVIGGAAGCFFSRCAGGHHRA
jgi:hypothetical protein